MTNRHRDENPIRFDYDVCVVGGCGHVGLPLSITFASEGLKVAAYDTNEKTVEIVRSGRMPFMEEGAEAVLQEVIGKTLHVANDVELVSRSRYVVIIIGTPVDEHLNPHFNLVKRVLLSVSGRSSATASASSSEAPYSRARPRRSRDRREDRQATSRSPSAPSALRKGRR